MYAIDAPLEFKVGDTIKCNVGGGPGGGYAPWADEKLPVINHGNGEKHSVMRILALRKSSDWQLSISK
jgi:hypothetical protein